MKQLLKYNWLLVVIILFFVEVIVNPIGEFPLNDDWAYSRTVYDFINTGVYKLSFWQSIFGFTQFVTAVFFCKVFGFSFTLLRCLTLFCLALSVYVLELILKILKVNTTSRLMLLLLFAFNPLCLCLSNTYLSDMFQMPFTLIAFYGILMFIQDGKMKHYVLFILFMVFAILNRQSGVVLAFVFVFCYIGPKKWQLKNVFLTLFPMLFVLICISFFNAFVRHFAQVPHNFNLQWHLFIDVFSSPKLPGLKTLLYSIFNSSLALGFFVLPLSITSFMFFFQKVKNSRLLAFVFILYCVCILGKVFFSKNVLPFVGNIFYHVGTGPVILTGYNTDVLSLPRPSAQVFWLVLSFICGISFFVSFYFILGISGKNILRRTLFLLLLLYFLPLCLNYANDRYLLYILPFYFLAFIISADVKLNWFYFIIAFLPIFCFSIAGTHDYMEINRARWKATNHLTKDLKIKPQNIDGGFEFNGWYLASEKNYIPSHKGRWWWVDKDDYVISPGNLKGYSVESEYYFSSWMSYDFNKINVLKKDSLSN